MSKKKSNYSCVRAAALDGRLSNPWWRQSQLQNLHDGLVRESTALISATVQDSKVITHAEAKIEYYLAVKTVKHHYSALRPDEELQEEYKILKGNLPTRREPFGIAYICPISHTYLYSVVSAVSAALAAGNCVVLNVGRDIPRWSQFSLNC